MSDVEPDLEDPVDEEVVVAILDEATEYIDLALPANMQSRWQEIKPEWMVVVAAGIRDSLRRNSNSA